LQAPQKYLDRVQEIQDQKLRTYAAMVCGMDDAIGKVMDKLSELKLTDNTLIFFFSDNGGPVSVTNCRNTPLRGAKGQLYEGGIRVPFVVSWPAKLKPGTFHDPVSSLDVFPTAIAASGRDAPWKSPLDGVDLLPPLRGESKQSLADRTLYWRTGGGENFAARRGASKLVKVGEKPAELYDLSADVAEQTNLAETKSAELAAFQKKFDEWNQSLVAPKWQNPQPPKKK
jgi:arylsulfatase A-like enzyme